MIIITTTTEVVAAAVTTTTTESHEHHSLLPELAVVDVMEACYPPFVADHEDSWHPQFGLAIVS